MLGGEQLTSVIDVIRALSELIEKEYPDYPVVDYDVDEDFPRPSYFINVENVHTEWVAVDYIRESSELEITFFAPNRYAGFSELLDMKNNLTRLFDEPLQVSDNFYVTLLDTTSELFKSDKVLTFSFTANIVNKVERTETDDYMEHLDFKEEVIN